MLSKKLQQSVCNIVVVAFNKAKVKRYILLSLLELYVFATGDSFLGLPYDKYTCRDRWGLSTLGRGWCCL